MWSKILSIKHWKYFKHIKCRENVEWIWQYNPRLTKYNNDITEPELTIALKNINSGKTSGNNELTKKIYENFWEDIQKLFATLNRTKTSNNEHDCTPVKYLNALHHSRTQKQSRH